MVLGVVAQVDKPDLFYILAELNFDGQQTLVDASSFEVPNFSLVCRLLNWFVRLLDDESLEESLHEPIGNYLNQEDEIQFLTRIGHFFAKKLDIHLDLIALYNADESCFSELMKVAKPIYEAAKLLASEPPDGDERIESLLSRSRKLAEEARLELMNDLEFLESSSQVEKVKDKSKLTDQEQTSLPIRIAATAADLESLLVEEDKFACERLRVMDRELDMAQIERLLGDSFQDIVDKTKELAELNEGLEKDLTRLDERLESKELEIEETRQSLNELLVESPEYYNEYERLKVEYETSYDEYVSRHRCFSYLKWFIYSSPKSYLGRGTSELSKADGHTERVDWSSARSVPNQLELEPVLTAAGDPADARAPAETVGPARLLESLFEGTSKPRSASLLSGSAEAAIATGGAASEGRALGTGSAEATGSRRARLDGDKTDLELEGLLNEFVADSELLMGTSEDDEIDLGGAS